MKVSPLLEPDASTLREAVQATTQDPDVLPKVARYVTQAYQVTDITPDQMRVLERSLRGLGGEVFASDDGRNAVIIGSTFAFGELHIALMEWGPQTEELGKALRDTLFATAR